MPKIKITLNRVIQARNDLGKTQDKAANTKDHTDQLILLKLGYISATEIIPDITEHPHQHWVMHNAIKYNDAIISRRNRNLTLMKLYPHNTKGYLKRVKMENILKHRLEDLGKFMQYSLRNGLTYIDNYPIFDIDHDYRIIYPSYLEFDDYLKPYRQFLQDNYVRLQKSHFDLDKYKTNDH